MATGTDKINAANEIKRFANSFRHVLAAADDLEKAGTLENAVAEAEARMSAIKAEQEKAQAGIDQAKEKAAEIVAAAQAKADKLVEDASDLLELSNSQAEKVTQDARAKASAATKQGEASLQGIKEQTAAARDDLADINAEVAEAQQKLDAVNKQLADVRKRVG
jgi:chromosome segregation ATPase